jgi:hypothetical protein
MLPLTALVSILLKPDYQPGYHARWKTRREKWTDGSDPRFWHTGLAQEHHNNKHRFFDATHLNF